MKRGWRLTPRGEFVVMLALTLAALTLIGLAGGLEAGVWP